MYNKDGTRLQNKGVNLIVCLTLCLNIKVIYVRYTHSPHRFRPEDRSTNHFQAILSYYDD